MSDELTDVVTPMEKLELFIKDFNSHLEEGKSLSARMKTLQKQLGKNMKRRSAKVVDPDAPKKLTALQKPVPISDELCEFLGFKKGVEYSRQEVTASINKYVKDSNIQDPANRRFILVEGSEAADKLKVLLRSPDQPLTFFNIQRYLKPHYVAKPEEVKPEEVKPEEVKPEEVKSSVVPDSEVVEDSKAVKQPVKKRIIRRSTA